MVFHQHHILADLTQSPQRDSAHKSGRAIASVTRMTFSTHISSSIVTPAGMPEKSSYSSDVGNKKGREHSACGLLIFSVIGFNEQNGCRHKQSQILMITGV
jgi:hypothetical protein